MWVFGYGSIVWRPGFSYRRRLLAHVRGYERRFYQGSIDHRGVPGRPGRVVTLVPVPEGVCRGVAFELDPETRDEIAAQLDHREKGGYERVDLDVHLTIEDSSRTERVSVYIATASNPNYLGRASVEQIAREAHRSVGPSGTNREYILELAAALRQMQIHDEHVFAVERALLALDEG